ncbi:hypothetical protein MUP05_01615 [Candidatus Bathyarchaeota archaeon]|nr:hypothetical protein [Candidatus Bathyarchaeota archaeon]
MHNEVIDSETALLHLCWEIFYDLTLATTRKWLRMVEFGASRLVNCWILGRTCGFRIVELLAKSSQRAIVCHNIDAKATSNDQI